MVQAGEEGGEGQERTIRWNELEAVFRAQHQPALKDMPGEHNRWTEDRRTHKSTAMGEPGKHLAAHEPRVGGRLRAGGLAPHRGSAAQRRFCCRQLRGQAEPEGSEQRA